MKSFFSIIIPTYNSENHLSGAIKSVIEQNFQDFEILVMDGGSKDRTLDIANSFNDTRIKVHSEPDKGVYDAMNKGIEKAFGEWLYFLGSDDWLYNSEVLEKVANFSTSVMTNIIYGDVFMEKFNARYDGKFSLEKLTTSNICHQAIFYKHSIFITERYNLRYKILADYDLNLRIFLNPEIKVLYIDLIIAHYSKGGLSDLSGDVLFAEDRNKILQEYGVTTLPLKVLRTTCKNIFEFMLLICRRIFLYKYRFL